MTKKKLITIGTCGIIGTGIIIVAPTILIKAGALIFAGFSLSLGFWAGKKLTNKIDELWLTQDFNLKKIANDIA